MRFSRNSGLLSAIAAFAIWGIFPLYWRLFATIDSQEILAYRIWWSFVAMLVLIIALKMGSKAKADFRELVKTPKRLCLMIASSALISCNWGIYIWAVNDGRVLESSLGYYINPLVNVLLGMIFLSEKFNRWQALSFFLATAGVLNMAVNIGTVPWVSLLLALSMGLYSLCKKLLHMNVFTNMTIETAIIAPFALAYIGYANAGQELFTGTVPFYLLLMSTGVVTAIPLLLFANAANNLPLSIIGFTQYLSPTIIFLIAVFLYKEPFSQTHLFSFALIWLALIIFTLANTGFFKMKNPAST